MEGTREMNANELADALQETEPYYSTDYKLFDQAATMLRNQLAEIEALKKEAALQRLSDFTQEVEAKYGITTKWDGITTYHETTEPIGKAQKNG